MGFGEILGDVLGTPSGLAFFYVAISFLMAMIMGYLFNYFIMRELREMNKQFRDLNYMLASYMQRQQNGVKKNEPQPPAKPNYQMKKEEEKNNS